ncbi:hypothetical protein CC79DRAFT_1323921 [Sarocladium strictum]
MMKSAKPTAADASSHRRSQPARQARTNPPRNRALGDRDAESTGPAGDQPIDIFPAVTHFADTMTALPKELVRHFTLLKEVDAKVFGPEEQLFKLVAAATDPAAVPKPQNELNAASALMGTPSSSGLAALEQAQAAADGDSGFPSTFELASLPKQQLLRQTSFKIHEMLVSLEEKNHVLSTANEALQKQLTRIEDVWPFLEDEFSDEAKWGSLTHWAYPENRSGKASHAERTRRDGAAAISAAAQALADEAAARSDARKQAVQAKKSLKNNHLESDFDDHDGKAKGEGKKPKARKTAAETAVGLGITSGGAANGNPPPKKRKVDKTANGTAAAADRAMAGVFGGANQPKAKTNSPRGTPAPDGPKKRKALPSASGQAKKSKNGTTAAAMSPSIVSSPVMPPLPEPKTTSRASPAPVVAPRPPSSRSRQNSLHSVAENGKSRPSSAAATKPNGQVPPTPDSVAPKDWPRPGNEVKPVEKAAAPIKTEPAKKDVEKEEKPAAAGPTSNKKETKAEENERKNEPTPPIIPPMPTVTTKSGRASKPSTPALATFQEAARARPSRSGEKDGAGGKKGHKKSGSTVQQAPPPPPPPRVRDEDATSSVHGDDEEGDIDADEPRYCYCDGVSYGEMVACDSDDCAREWFHLACVGLKVAPGSKTKWYCEDCKERLRGVRQRTNGR